jgi:hypothetical protein
MKTHRLSDELRCLRCNHILNGAGSIESEQQPQKGDLAVCVMCNCLMIYTAKLKLRNLTDAEVTELGRATELQRVLDALDAFRLMMTPPEGHG